MADTCGTCKFSAPIKENLTKITCYGGVPQLVALPMKVQTPQGITQSIQPMAFDPIIDRDRIGCALHKPKLVL